MNMKRFLIFVLILFIAMLIGLYIASEKADPVLLDEQGQPINPPVDDPQ